MWPVEIMWPVACLHLMLQRYCRFFQAKSTEGHARGWLRSGSSENSSVPHLTSRHERRRLWHGLWVVRCPHLWSRSATSGCVWLTEGRWQSRFLKVPVSQTGLFGDAAGSRLHRSRLRRSNTSCLGGQLLPPPVRRLQRPACSSMRAAPCIHPCSRTASAAASKSGAVELGVGRPPRPSTGGKRRSKRPRDGRPRERGNCFGRG